MKQIVFGQRLKSARSEAGLTQQELADIVGVKNKQTVSAWENGLAYPQVAELLKLGSALNVSLDWLFGNSAGFLKGFKDPEMIDMFSQVDSIPGEWHIAKDDNDESAGDLNEHNSLIYTANIRKFLQRVGIDSTFESDFEAFVAYLRFRSREHQKSPLEKEGGYRL